MNNTSKEDNLSGKLYSFLLARRSLQKSSVVHLLLSSSFGINAVFYAVWLGYVMGVWALLIQAAWAISFVLLARFSDQFATIQSLHDLLGQRFGNGTRIVASLASFIGILYFVGWEIGIGTSTIAPLASTLGIGNANQFAEILTGFIAIFAVWYSVTWGLKGNAKVDTYFNFMKVGILLSISGISIFHLLSGGIQNIFVLSPSFSSALAKLGIIGFITNILFNLLWQFVDNSTWQSIIGGQSHSKEKVSQGLYLSSKVIFLSIGFLGTLIGMSLSQFGGLSPDNILPMIANLFPHYRVVLSCGLIILTITSMMSLIDGMVLASALTLAVDILPSLKKYKVLSPKNEIKVVKVTLIVSGIIGIWGIDYVLRHLNTSIFDFVYIVVITQLSLIGPVLIALRTKNTGSKYMWQAIVVALIIGFGSIVFGTRTQNSILVDSAGALTITTSIMTGFFISRVFSKGF